MILHFSINGIFFLIHCPPSATLHKRFPPSHHHHFIKPPCHNRLLPQHLQARPHNSSHFALHDKCDNTQQPLFATSCLFCTPDHTPHSHRCLQLALRPWLSLQCDNLNLQNKKKTFNDAHPLLSPPTTKDTHVHHYSSHMLSTTDTPRD